MLIELLEKAYKTNPEFIVLSARTVRDYKIYLRSVWSEEYNKTTIAESPTGKTFIAYKNTPIVRSVTCVDGKVYVPTDDESERSCDYVEQTSSDYVIEHGVRYLLGDIPLGFTSYKFLKEVVL
jgi:hypothetical protein